MDILIIALVAAIGFMAAYWLFVGLKDGDDYGEY